MVAAGFSSFAFAIAVTASYKTGKAEKKTKPEPEHLQHGKGELKPVCLQTAREGHR